MDTEDGKWTTVICSVDMSRDGEIIDGDQKTGFSGIVARVLLRLLIFCGLYKEIPFSEIRVELEEKNKNGGEPW